MNNLSWFLYFADLVEKLTNFIGMATLLSVVFLVMWILISVIGGEVPFPKIIRYKLFYSLLFIGLVILTIIPSKQTMYMIASSQVAQTVTESDTGKRILNDVQKKLFEKLEEK